jgi:cytidylate kinase
MYRAVTLEALRRGIRSDDADALGALADALDLIVDARVVIGGTDVTEEIRGEDVNASVSVVAAHPPVRAALVRRQRGWVAERGAGVVEGRDIGSVVLPDAPLKVYLTASEQERARRRAAEVGLGTNPEPVAMTRASITARDALDSNRAVSPLIIADGAVVIDSTDRSAASVIAEILALAHQAAEKGAP